MVGRRKIVCRAAALNAVEPPHTFLEFFLEFFGPAYGSQRELSGARFGFMESQKTALWRPAEPTGPMKGGVGCVRLCGG